MFLSAAWLLSAALALLLVLIFWVRLHAFPALLITTLSTGLLAGNSGTAVVQSIQKGIGSTLGGLAPVIGLGVLLGALLASTGAARLLSTRMLEWLGVQRASWALMATSFVIGIVLFYNVGFVVLAPLVFTMAATHGLPLLPLAIAMAAPLSVTHGFLPPHPGPVAIAGLLSADLGKTLLLGILVALPAILIGGVWLPARLKHLQAHPPEGLVPVEAPADPGVTPPGFGTTLLLALLPVLLMGLGAFSSWFLPEGHRALGFLQWMGDPLVALLLAVLLVLADARRRGAPVFALQEQAVAAMGPAAMLLLIIGMGGAFKQVLVDTGMGESIAQQMAGFPGSPLLLGWLMATVLRIAVGSATVAGMTAAGIIQPLMALHPDVSPELMTLSIGAGSLMCSHVNDTGFWMFKEWFGLGLKETFLSWTLMETLVGLSGLAGVMLLEVVI